jgi:large subunit ribosomal protein L21
MYAIIETGGKQYRVQPGQTVDIERLDADEDGAVQFDRVLMLVDGETVRIGSPLVDGARVTGKVLGEIKNKKVIAFKKRRRKDSQSKRGHRQIHARVEIDGMSAS